MRREQRWPHIRVAVRTAEPPACLVGIRRWKMVAAECMVVGPRVGRLFTEYMHMWPRYAGGSGVECC